MGVPKLLKSVWHQGRLKLDHVGANSIDITGGCDSSFHLVAEPADKLADLPAHELDDQFFCPVRVSVFRIGLVRLLRLTSPIRPGFSPGGALNLFCLSSVSRSPVIFRIAPWSTVESLSRGAPRRLLARLPVLCPHRRLG